MNAVQSTIPYNDNDVRQSAQESHSTWDRITDASGKVSEFCEKTLWKYVRETGNLAKRTIKVISVSETGLKDKLDTIIPRIGLLSAFSILFSLKSIKSDINTIKMHIKNHDAEGIAFSVADFMMKPVDLLDSIITLYGGLATIVAIPAVVAFSLLALPLGLCLLGYSAILGAYNVIRCSINLNALPKHLDAMNLQAFKNYMEEKIEVTSKERKNIESDLEKRKKDLELKKFQLKLERKITLLRDRKRNTMARHTDAKVVNIMSHTLKHFSLKPDDLDTGNKALNDIKLIIARKITFDALGSAGSLALAALLATTLLFPISAFIVPSVAGARAVLAITRHSYQHAWMNEGIELKSFLQ